MIDVSIIGTGSTGNMSEVNGDFAVDLGITKKALLDSSHASCLKEISAAFITHEHFDHANPAMVKYLFEVRPDLFTRQLFMPQKTYEKLTSVNSSVMGNFPTKNIINENSSFDFKTRHGKWRADCYCAPHGDAECVGFIFTSPQGEKLFWGTDLETTKRAPVDGVHFDAICLEGNWDEDKLYEALKNPDTAAHAESSLRHQSTQAFEKFCQEHAKAGTRLIQLHMSDAFGSYSKLNNVYLEPTYT